MDINDKPLDTNGEVQESNESQDDNLEEIFGESGNEDVGSESELSLDQLNQVTGRQFKSLEDFQKHYKNLNSLVGDQKRIETEKKAKELDLLKNKARDDSSPSLAKEIEALKADFTEDRFLRNNPTANEHLELVRSVSKAKGISLDKAWNDHVKDIASGYAASKKEKEIGVETKNRINPQTKQRLNTLTEEYQKTGSGDAQDALVAAWLGKK